MSAHEHSKKRHIACTHVFSGCEFTASAATEEDLLRQIVTHAEHVHGVTEVTPELAAKVQTAITRR